MDAVSPKCPNFGFTKNNINSSIIDVVIIATGELGTVAGECKQCRWVVTLIDVHSLGKGK